MKGLLVNGSPLEDGGTHAALSAVETGLKENGIETEWFFMGTQPVHGCIDCCACARTNRCAFADDPCNALIEAFLRADGVVVGTPVYFASANGALCALLDRVFYAASRHGRLLKGKPAAAVASCFRAGATATLDRLNKYFTYSEMPVVSSNYWNMTFAPDTSVADDVMGRKILKQLGVNMSELLKR